MQEDGEDTQDFKISRIRIYTARFNFSLIICGNLTSCHAQSLNTSHSMLGSLIGKTIIYRLCTLAGLANGLILVNLLVCLSYFAFLLSRPIF